jgi:cytochrome c553
VRIVLRISLALLALLVVGIGTVYGLSERRLRRVHAVPPIAPLASPTDSASLARGEHLARAVANCVECHGEDFGGRVYLDAGPLGIVAGPNLSGGRGGVGPSLTDDDWVRAIRHGVDRGGRSLLVMPSETYVHLSQPDLEALIAYLRGVPPVDREVPETRLRLLGRALLATGRLPILVAEKTPRPDLPAAVAAGPTADYGRYLADVAGCRGCHGLELSGGRVAGPPGTPQAANLTPAGPIGAWSEEDFVRAMREGRRPDGSSLDVFMPWPLLGRMTDEELRALWLYLTGVPPRETGNR